MTAIGIVDLATFIPEGRMSSAALARLTSIPEAVIRDKFGIYEKAVAGEDEQPSTMALKAARLCLKRSAVDGADVDAVNCFGSEYKDHFVWTMSTWLIEQIGARHAFGFDMYATCTGFIIALQIARDMMRGNPNLRHILLVGASKESDLLNYSDPLSRFIINFADGAGAVLLRRDHPCHRVLDTATRFDGRFSRCVHVPTVGSASTDRDGDDRHVFRVNEPQSMKEHLDPVSVPNMAAVIEDVINKGDFVVDDVAFLAILHTKRSFFRAVLDQVNISEEKTLYPWHYGHVQTIDTILAIERARDLQLLQSGDLIVLASAGAGYSWGAATLRWGTG